VIVNRDERRGRATSFAEVADAYERARPGYPEDAVRWLTGPTPLDVVDLGAGTGKLTRSLVALGHRVTAVEPLPEMLSHLRAALPEVTAVEGSAESIPLPSESADVVTIAQAFHWFDHASALKEIARVLRPGGLIAPVWNSRDQGAPWVSELSEIALGTESVRPLTDVVSPVGESGLFGAHVQVLDRQSLDDLVLSRSYCAVMSDEERAPVLAGVERLFDAHAVDGCVTMAYTTECFRAPRL
jgi:ubiquinone/menaquinone biosynthesis C-methylase UbiE